MPLSAAVLETLHSIVGDIGFITDKATLAPYLIESRGNFQSICDVLIKPATSQEVASILAICNDNDIPVVPQGGNTGHCGGAVAKGGVLLNLSRLNQIHQLDPLNATITVGAGCILADIQEKAEEAGFIFPLSLASQGSCQIGGNLSTNAGGVQVLRYGNMRDLTLGLEVCLPDGRLWDGLRALRKDNTGYDLKHLFIGGEGTLGVITAATLKLFPKPKDTACAFLSAKTPAHLMEAFAALRDDFADELNAFEFMPRFGLDLVLKHMDDARDPFSDSYACYALVEVSTSRPNASLNNTLENTLQNLYKRDFLQNVIIAQNTSQARQFWNLRENMSQAQKREGASIKHDVSVPLSKIPEFLSETSHMVKQVMNDARICAFGHVGDGNIHFNISQPVHMERHAFLSHSGDFNDLVHEMAEKFAGSFSAEHGIGLLKVSEMETFRTPVEIDIMRHLKAALDPNAIMNPGKILSKK